MDGMRRRLGRRLQTYLELTRPFTLLTPAVGCLAGGVVALNLPVAHRVTGSRAWGLLLLGALAGALLNASSNILNQILDVDIDCINKPDRPIPSERAGEPAAWLLVILLAGASFALATLVGWPLVTILGIAAAAAVIYSVPPLRMKRRGIWANVTIALPRGLLLPVAGWAVVADLRATDPWFLGLIFALFVLGAATTKDFSDMEGDEQHGCRTLPLDHGVRPAAAMIAPSFVVPWLLIPVGLNLGLLHGSRVFLTILSLFLAVYGCFVSILVLRRSEILAGGGNHVSWNHMYLLYLVALAGTAAGYVL